MGESARAVRLSIVIVNWHSADYVSACVRSIREHTRELAFEIVVVDNASFDACGERLARECPEAVFVQSGENLGFAGANNLGVQHARGTTLLFLNPDTEIRNGAIDRLYAHLDSLSDAGVLGARLLNSDGSLQTSCVQALPTVLNQALDAEWLRRLFPRARLWGTRALIEPGPMPAEVEAVSGACMMMRRSVFEAVGGFSQDFFMYGEDLDLCDRVRRAGFRNWYAADCEVVHHGGGSSRHVGSASVVMMRQSVSLLLRRSRGPLASAGYRVGLMVMACLRLGALAVLSPVWVLRRGARSWAEAWVKWLAILRWTIGIHREPRRAAAMRRQTRPLGMGV